VTHSRRFKSESNIVKCVICSQIMANWDSIEVPIEVPIFKLIQRPEDA